VDWHVTIPLPDGSQHPITQQQVTTSQKMLGVWSNPTGNDSDHLTKHVLGKYQTWLDRSSNCHLPNRFNWISYKYKLWPGLKYGLATLATPTSQIRDLIRKLDYLTLPLLGVNRSVKHEWRTIPRAFGGIGMFDLAVEQMIGWSNMVLQHFGAPTTLGHKMKATLEALQIEIGCTGNPLSERYDSRGILATPSWITSVWERSQQYKLEFILDYDTIQAPRENDITIIELLLQNGITGMNLRRMNRCRIKLQAFFLSDLTTASGRHLEAWVRGSRRGRQSRFRFPREHPSPCDWELWDCFWDSWVNRNGTLPHKLGRWQGNPHQQWDWFLDKQRNTLWNNSTEGWLKYEFTQLGRNTRGNQVYTLTGQWNLPPLEDFLLASVRDVNGRALLTDTGLGTPCITKSNKNFWEFATEKEHAWMWDFVDGKHQDMSWVNTALRKKTAIMVTDGSFNRSLAPTISGAGWVLVCTDCKQMINGCFYENSPKASSYRGELLGLTAIHHLVAYTLDYYEQPTASGSMHCDNKGALHQASMKRRRVRNNCKHADLLRNLRFIKGKYNFDVSYEYVKAHQDDVFTLEDLPLIQQLNVMCDQLAKQAVQASIKQTSTRTPQTQLLPREQAALVIDRRKQTTDTATDLRFYLGKIDARDFFTKPPQILGNTNIGGLGWSAERFDCVEWEILRDVITSKPDMYGIWLAKQTKGSCATRRNMARILGNTDDRCPNCLVGPERSAHLNKCCDQGRTHLFEMNVRELHAWMNNNTDWELRYWIIHYLLLRGERSMSSLGDMSPWMKEIAYEFDLIGWEDMLHGRLPKSLHTFQSAYCRVRNSRLTGTDWMKKFTAKLLEISHSQWLFRNFLLHNNAKGHLHRSHQAAVLVEIAALATTPPEGIPEESRFLLEIDLMNLDKSPLTQQEYWIAAMTAAISAGRRVARPHHRSCTHIRSTSDSEPIRVRRDRHRARRRIESLLNQIQEDTDMEYGKWRLKRMWSGNDSITNGSNKRFRKPD
jgi:hypothetical protein